MNPTLPLDWVWFSFVPWSGRRNRCHHLVAALADAGGRVLWIDPPVRRRRLPERVEVRSNLWVLPTPGVSVVSGLGQRRFAPVLRAEVAAWRGERPLVALVQLPVLADLALALDADVLVYDSLDDWRHALDGRAVRVEVAERRLAARADLVLAVSEPVQERFRGLGAEPRLLGNGCRAEDWSCVDGLAPAAELAALPAPRLLFFGGLDRYLDVEALRAAAASLSASWVFVGPRTEPGVADALSRLPGGVVLGERSYEELPSFVAGCDVCLLPLRADDPFNRARDCLKLYEYLASGRPIASAALPQARRFAEWIEVADPEGDGFLGACRRALADRELDRRAARVAAASSNSWTARAAQLAALVQERLLC